MSIQAVVLQRMIWKVARIIPQNVSQEWGRSCKALRVFIGILHTKCRRQLFLPAGSHSTAHTAPPARSQVQQQGQHHIWTTALRKNFNQASLVQKAKGGGGMPGSDGPD